MTVNEVEVFPVSAFLNHSKSDEALVVIAVLSLRLTGPVKVRLPVLKVPPRVTVPVVLKTTSSVKLQPALKVIAPVVALSAKVVTEGFPLKVTVGPLEIVKLFALKFPLKAIVPPVLFTVIELKVFVLPLNS